MSNLHSRHNRRSISKALALQREDPILYTPYYSSLVLALADHNNHCKGPNQGKSGIKALDTLNTMYLDLSESEDPQLLDAFEQYYRSLQL